MYIGKNAIKHEPLTSKAQFIFGYQTWNFKKFFPEAGGRKSVKTKMRGDGKGVKL